MSALPLLLKDAAQEENPNETATTQFWGIPVFWVSGYNRHGVDWHGPTELLLEREEFGKPRVQVGGQRQQAFYLALEHPHPYQEAFE